jgi:hypothetical protein
VSTILGNDHAFYIHRGPAPKAGAAGETGQDTSLSPNAPQVGIFWCVLDRAGVRHLLVEQWQRTGTPTRSLTPVVRGHEYEEWPRGRVVFDRKADRYFLYCDRLIRNAGLVPELISLFRLSLDRVTVRGDSHYRSPLSIEGGAIELGIRK